MVGLSTVPTGITEGGDIPGPSLSSHCPVGEVGSSAIVWVGFQQERVLGLDVQSVKSSSREKTPQEGSERGRRWRRRVPSLSPSPEAGPAGPGSLRRGRTLKNRGLGGPLSPQRLPITSTVAPG